MNFVFFLFVCMFFGLLPDNLPVSRVNNLILDKQIFSRTELNVFAVTVLHCTFCDGLTTCSI